MKIQKLLFLFIISFASLPSYSQESYNMNDFELNSTGVLYISENDSIKGTIRFNELTSGALTIIDAADNNKRFKAKEIAGFKTQNPTRTFYSVKSDGLDKTIMLYEDITPNGGKKLMLLKTFVQDGILISGGMVQGKWETQMYSPVSKKLIGSNFKKVAEQLKDCPTLADKIASKQKGYYFGLMSVPVLQEKVLTNIVTEYNACQ